MHAVSQGPNIKVPSGNFEWAAASFRQLHSSIISGADLSEPRRAARQSCWSSVTARSMISGNQSPICEEHPEKRKLKKIRP